MTTIPGIQSVGAAARRAAPEVVEQLSLFAKESGDDVARLVTSHADDGASALAHSLATSGDDAVRAVVTHADDVAKPIATTVADAAKPLTTTVADAAAPVTTTVADAAKPVTTTVADAATPVVATVKPTPSVTTVKPTPATTTVTPAVTPVTTTTATTVATDPAAVIAAGGGGWTSMLLGGGAIASGLGLTVFTTLKDSITKEGTGTSSNNLFGPTAGIVTAGGGVWILAEKLGIQSKGFQNGIRGLAAMLIVGGIAGWAQGTWQTLRDADVHRSESNALLQEGLAFKPGAVDQVSFLNGVQVANAEVMMKPATAATTTAAGSANESPVIRGQVVPTRMYLDVDTDIPLSATDLGTAVAQARSIVQTDGEDYRARGIVQTSDGVFHAVRFMDNFDQIDGPGYGEGANYDADRRPFIGKRAEALRAIVGVEWDYIYPDALDPTAKPPTLGGSNQIAPGSISTATTSTTTATSTEVTP